MKSLFVRIAGGIETGVLGGIVMLVWFALISIWQGQFWFAMPNLMASAFYGESVFRAGAGVVTLVGIALHLTNGGVAGALFGLVVPNGLSPVRVLLFGLAAGLLWFYFNEYVLWRRISPLVSVYTAESSLIAAHLLFGLCLWRTPRRIRHLGMHLG